MGFLHPASDKAQTSDLLAILIAGGSGAFIAECPNMGFNIYAGVVKTGTTTLFLTSRFPWMEPRARDLGISNYKVK